MKQETVVTRIRVSAAERASGQLHDATIAEIFDGLDRAGFIVIADLVPERTCDSLAASVVEDVRRIRLRDESTRHEISTAPGHLQLGLRRYGEFVAPEVVANPLLEHAVGAVLGQGAWLGFYNGNVNCPGSGYQPWHFDRPYFWKTPAQAQADGVAWPPLPPRCRVPLR